jgi:hypothetical protein
MSSWLLGSIGVVKIWTADQLVFFETSLAFSVA